MKKLHIGCGHNYLPGFTNVDLFSSVDADIYADMTALPFERESFDLLYCCHCLEHVHRHCVLSTLSHWRDLLKPGGTLRLAVPDFGAVVKWYNDMGNLDDLIGLLYGGQNHPRNNHFIIFDHETLARDLRKVGFRDIRPWRWQTTFHSDYDDYSQAYLPGFQKDTGMLMSLNLEATK